jgi:hypothetical protein
LAGKFEVETVPGDHLGIMTTHYEQLASAISRYAEEALREVRNSEGFAAC